MLEGESAVEEVRPWVVGGGGFGLGFFFSFCCVCFSNFFFSLVDCNSVSQKYFFLFSSFAWIFVCGLIEERVDRELIGNGGCLQWSGVEICREW